MADSREKSTSEVPELDPARIGARCARLRKGSRRLYGCRWRPRHGEGCVDSPLGPSMGLGAAKEAPRKRIASIAEDFPLFCPMVGIAAPFVFAPCALPPSCWLALLTICAMDCTLSGRHFLKCLKYSSSMNSGKGTFQGYWPGRRTSSGSGPAPGPFEGEHRKDENASSPRPTVGTFPWFFLRHASPIQSKRYNVA
jgi:hypothetical protein